MPHEKHNQLWMSSIYLCRSTKREKFRVIILSEQQETLQFWWMSISPKHKFSILGDKDKLFIINLLLPCWSQRQDCRRRLFYFPCTIWWNENPHIFVYWPRILVKRRSRHVPWPHHAILHVSRDSCSRATKELKLFAAAELKTK